VTRRRREARLERALTGPARLLAGYAAAVASWPVVIWLFDGWAAGAAFPSVSLFLTASMVALWRAACARERRRRSSPEAGAAGGRGAPASVSRAGPPS
jgi:hypothetical protein